MKIRNLKVNKENILKLVAAISLGGIITFSTIQFGHQLLPDIGDDNTPVTIESVEASDSSIYDQEDNTSITIEIAEDEEPSEFKKAFESSPKLVDEFSIVYPQIAGFVKEYGDYFDQQVLIKRTNDVKVETIDNDKFGSTILAYYDFDTNTIYLKPKLANKKTSQVIELKEHELFHFIFGKGFSRGTLNINHTGLAIDEGVATLLTQETGDFDNTVVYKKNANYVRVLCELIGTKNFLSAYGSNDLNKLYDYLSQYISKSDAKKLVKYIDEACNDYGYQITDADKQAWAIIESIYAEKHGESIKDSDDYIMKIYSNMMYKTSYKIEGANSYADVSVRKNYFLNIDVPKVIFEKDGVVYGEIICESGADEFSPSSGNISRAK